MCQLSCRNNLAVSVMVARNTLNIVVKVQIFNGQLVD